MKKRFKNISKMLRKTFRKCYVKRFENVTKNVLKML